MAPPDTIKVRAGTYRLTTPINIGKYVTILGGYNFKGVRNWKIYHTIIDGQNTTRCLNITGPAIIDGFTIRNGSTTGQGGGLYIHSEPKYCSTLDFYHVPKIRNCTIENNVAGSDGYGVGGGLYDGFEIDDTYKHGSNTQIENCTFEGNSADAGGGVYHLKSSITFEKCIFRDNQAAAPGSIGGGAIAGEYNNSDTGGLIYIINCLFDGNSAGNWGGAVATSHVFPQIQNSTFYGNSADISGGAYHGNLNADAPFVRNCIFWNNSPDQLFVSTTNPYWYVSQSDVQGGWTGPGVDNIDENPDFVSPATGDFRLSLGSPCIDTGYRWGMPEDDLGGVLRPHDGDADGTAEWDMGAYEFFQITMLGDLDWDWDVDGRDLPVFGGSFGTDIGEYGYNASVDFDENGSVDGDDLRAFAGNFGSLQP